MAEPGLTRDELSDLRGVLNVAPQTAERAINYLVNCLETTRVKRQVYARRHRIKSENGVREKVERKRAEDRPTYGWTDITDIVGIRIITLYRDDIVDVADVIMLALLDRNKDVRPCPFTRSALKEVRLFMSNATKKSELATSFQRLASRVRRKGDSWRYKGPEMGERYSSIHFVTSVQIEEDKPFVPVEIQIRSVFEDAWGEVDHVLVLEPKRRLGDGDVELRKVERHSTALKKMMDAAADLAGAMRDLRPIETAPANPIRSTLDGPGYVKEFCELLQVPSKVKRTLMSLVEDREKLDKAVGTRNTRASRADYIPIANGLAALLAEQLAVEGFLKGRRHGDEARELVYAVGMEEAICRLLSFEKDEIAPAVDQFGALTSEFPDHPVAWLRLGEALVRRMDMQEWSPTTRELARRAQDAYRRADDALEHLADLSTRKRFFAASDPQQEYIRNNLSRMKAYAIWRTAGRERGDRPVDKSATAAARTAFELTFRALPSVTERASRERLLNSMAYYAAETLDFAKRSRAAGAPLPVPDNELRGYLRELEGIAPAAGEAVLQTWDTIAYAFHMLDDSDAAKRAARKVLKAHQEQLRGPPRAVSNYVREQEALAVARALRILGISDDV